MNDVNLVVFSFFFPFVMFGLSVFSVHAYFSGGDIHGIIPLATSFITLCMILSSDKFWWLMTFLRNIPVFISRAFSKKKA